MNQEHKVTEHLPSDEFDKLLSRVIGLPNGAHTQPAVVQAIDFYGHTTSFMIQTVREKLTKVADRFDRSEA